MILKTLSTTALSLLMNRAEKLINVGSEGIRERARSRFLACAAEFEGRKKTAKITPARQAFLNKIWAEMYDPSICVMRCHKLNDIWSRVSDDGWYFDTGRWVYVA